MRGLLPKQITFCTKIVNGRTTLPETISELLGDGAGYDIESFTLEGDIKYIEVKTTKGSKNTSFFMSSNEKKFVNINKEKYYLYRVFEYDDETNSGNYFVLDGLSVSKLDFSPTQYRVSFVTDDE